MLIRKAPSTLPSTLHVLRVTQLPPRPSARTLTQHSASRSQQVESAKSSANRVQHANTRFSLNSIAEAQVRVLIGLGSSKRSFYTSKNVRADNKPSTTPSHDAKVSSSSSPQPLTTTEPVNEGHYAKFKKLVRKYGKIAIAVHLGIAGISLAGCYALVSMGVDVNKWLSMFGIGQGAAGGKMGTFAVAYIAHKATEIVRLPLTLVLTPIIAKKLNGNKEVEDEPELSEHGKTGEPATNITTSATPTSSSSTSSHAATSATTATSASKKDQHPS